MKQKISYKVLSPREIIKASDKGDFSEAKQEKIIEAAANILRKHKFEVDEHLDCKHPLYKSKT